jgi:hypothetical protein
MSSCSSNPKLFFLTDAATHLAYEIESAALKVESSGKTEPRLSKRPGVIKGGEKTLRGNKTIEINSIP